LGRLRRQTRRNKVSLRAGFERRLATCPCLGRHRELTVDAAISALSYAKVPATMHPLSPGCFIICTADNLLCARCQAPQFSETFNSCGLDQLPSLRGIDRRRVRDHLELLF